MLPAMKPERELEVIKFTTSKWDTKKSVCNSKDSYQFNLNITEVRKKAGLSVRRLAKYSGVSGGYISEMENGIHNNPSLDVLFKLSKVLNCKIDDLINY